MLPDVGSPRGLSHLFCSKVYRADTLSLNTVKERKESDMRILSTCMGGYGRRWEGKGKVDGYGGGLVSFSASSLFQ